MRGDSYDSTYRLKRISVKPILSFLLGIFAVFLLSRFLTAFVLKFDPYYIYVIAIGIVVAVVVSQKLELAILLYAFMAPFIIGASPGFQGTRSGYQPSVFPSQIGLIMLSGIWLTKAFFKHKQIAPRCSLYLPFFAFLFVCALSILTSYVIWDFDIPQSERRLMNMVSEVVLFGFCGMAFWLTASAIQHKEWIKPLFWPVLFAGLYNSVIRFAGIENPVVPIIRGDFLTAFAVTLVLARLLFGSDTRKVKFWLKLSFLVLLTATYFNLAWVSGWLTATFAMTAVIGFKSRKALTAVGLIGFFLMFIYPGLFNTVYHDSRKQGDMDRIVLWKDSIKMANSVNPMLGIGPSNYVAYAQKYGSIWYGDDTYDYAHSNYAQMIAEIGWLGFLSFLWLIFGGIRTGIRTVRKVPHEFKWFTVGVASIFIAVSVSSLVGDYLLPSRTNGGLNSFGSSVFVWMLLGAAVSAVRLTQKQPDHEEDAVDAEEVAGSIR